jgi:hypothetical protein
MALDAVISWEIRCRTYSSGFVRDLESKCKPYLNQLAGRRSRCDLFGLQTIDLAITRVAKDNTAIPVENDKALGQIINDGSEPRRMRAFAAYHPTIPAGGNVIHFG